MLVGGNAAGYPPSPFNSEATPRSQITVPAGMTAFLGMMTMPSRM